MNEILDTLAPWWEHGRLTLVSRLAPSEELGFVFQVATVFTATGLAVAWWRRRRHPDLDTFVITTSWTLLGVAIGAAIALAQAVLT